MRNSPLLLSAFLIFIALIGATPAQQPATVSSLNNEPMPFIRVDRVGEPLGLSFFVFNTSIRKYAVRNDGMAEVSMTHLLRRPLKLKMGGRSTLQRVYFIEHEGDLLLLYEVTDNKFAWGYLCRVNQNQRTFRWITPINGLNLGPGLVQGGHVYFSSSNLIAKVDLRTGAYVWQQTEFEKKYSPEFGVFQVPSIAGERVLFEEADEDGRTIELDKTTGAIVSVREQAKRPVFEPTKRAIRQP